METTHYSPADFPLAAETAMLVIVFFWGLSTLGLLLGLRGEGEKAVSSFGIAAVGIVGATMPLWIPNAVALVANLWQEIA